MLSADPAASQLRAALDANRKRSTKWTTDAEIGLLTEFWGRMARRDARAFSFVFNEQQLAGPVRKVFSEQAVKQKLKLLKQELPAEIYAWPAHTPADEVAAMFPVYKLLADAKGRQQVGRRCAHARSQQLLRSTASHGAQVASSKEYGTCTWEATPSRPDGGPDETPPGHTARRPHPAPTNG